MAKKFSVKEDRGTESLRPSSLRKRHAILQAAETVFLRDGFLGANMDELADLSGVSKQTVYTHFGSKENLFVELVSSMTTRAGDTVLPGVPEPRTGSDLPAYLTAYALRQLGAVMTPRILQLRRLVIGEVGRFPDLARVLWDRGPHRAVTALGSGSRTTPPPAGCGPPTRPGPPRSTTGWSWRLH